MTAELRPLLVVNPRSGGGRTGRNFPAMRPKIEKVLGPVDVEWTRSPGHGIDLARAGAEAGHGLVVAVGGDGTFNEVCNGVLLAKEAGGVYARVGLIGQGTGGDFRRTIGIEHDLDHYLEALGRGDERPMDVGRFSYRGHDGTVATRHFVNILSAGMGGLVDEYVARMPPIIGGTASYFLASAKALTRCRRGILSCTVHRGGQTELRQLDTLMVAICNGRYFSLGARSKLGFLATSRKIYAGAHLGDPGVEHFTCDRIEIRLENTDIDDRFLLDVDGEPLGRLPLAVELLPSALTLRA